MRTSLWFGTVMTGLAAILMQGCEAPTEPTGIQSIQLSHAPGASAILRGGGEFLVTIGEGFQGTFYIGNVQQDPSGAATGSFSFSLVFFGELLEFHGRTTCLTVDEELGRAWVGGVITRNNSTHPDWMTEIHQAGRDIWFRVDDNADNPADEFDRTTFVGFEGNRGIITSEEYCEVQFWDEESEPWAVVEGGLHVGAP